MYDNGVRNTLDSLLVADPDVMDRDQLAGFVSQLGRVRNWRAAGEVRVGCCVVDRWWTLLVEGCPDCVWAGNDLWGDALIRRRSGCRCCICGGNGEVLGRTFGVRHQTFIDDSTEPSGEPNQPSNGNPPDHPIDNKPLC